MARTKTADNITAEVESNVETTRAAKKPIVPKKVDPDTIVSVRNGTRGRLVYISPRTRERFVWDAFGDEQDIELRELRNAKSSAKDFFEKNWFMFDKENEWVITYLGLNKFYSYAVPIDQIDEIFNKSPEEITEILSNISDGQKKTIAYRAFELLSEKKIDSLKVIDALEKGLGIDLIEK